MRPLVRIAFWTIYLFALTNIIAALSWHVESITEQQQQTAAFPILFALCAAVVLLFSKGRYHSPILVAAWICWGVWAVGGFAGEYQRTGEDFRSMMHLLVKPWMVLVGLPWLATRAITPERLPRLIRVTVGIGAFGAMLTTLQVLVPGFMSTILSEASRGAGLWGNPNQGAFLLICCLFLSFIHPIERLPLRFGARTMLLIGIAMTFSRAAIVVVLIGCLVYGLASKRFLAVFQGLIAAAVLLAAIAISIEAIEAVSPNQSARLAAVRSFVQGDFSDEELNNRSELWRVAFTSILDQDGIVLGLGHRSMERIVPIGNGLGPHNYYVFVWGNSGFLAIVALLAYQFMLFQQALTCRHPRPVPRSWRSLLRWPLHSCLITR